MQAKYMERDLQDVYHCIDLTHYIQNCYHCDLKQMVICDSVLYK